MGQDLFGLQQIVAVDGKLIDVAFERIAAQTRLGVVGANTQIGRDAAVFWGLQIGGVEGGSVGVDGDAVDVGGQDTLPLVVSVAARITVVGHRLPGEGQVLPFADAVIGVGVHVGTAAADATEHAEVPTVAFRGRVGGVGVALEDDPAGSTGAADEAIVDGALAALLVPHGPDPEFDGQGLVGSGIVAGGPGHGGGGSAVAVVERCGSIGSTLGDRARRRVTRFFGVRGVTGRAAFTVVHGDVRARCFLIEVEVHRRLVCLNQAGVGNRPVGVRGILIMGQDFFRTELGGVERELVHAAEIGVQAGSRGVVVVADGQGRFAKGGDGRIVVIAVGDVTHLSAVAAAGPSLGDGLFAVDVHGDGGIGDVLGIINHYDVRPLAEHIGHAAEDIQARAAAGPTEHAEVPANPFAAGVIGIRLALEEHPSLSVNAGIRVSVVDGALAVRGLVAGWVEPRLEGERFVVLGVQGGIPGNLGAGGEIEEGGPSGITGDGTRHGVHPTQILGGDDAGREAGVQVVGAPDSAVAQAIVGGRTVCEDCFRVVRCPYRCG